MNTKRKCQVVLLPTSQQPLYNNIVTSPRYPNMIQKFGSFENSYPDECKVHHLYITSDEEIKEGDWYIGDNIIYNLVTKTNGMNPQKIISTTNPALKLPQPSKSFIDKYIDEYNKGNVVSKVEVEYVQVPNQIFISEIDAPYIQLKVNPDDTINIKPIKESWSREEVINLLDDFNTTGKFSDPYKNKIEFDKWIEDNL